MASLLSFAKLSSFSPSRLASFSGLRLSPSRATLSLKSTLSSFTAVSVSAPFLPTTFSSFPLSPISPIPSTPGVFAAKGYKMKTHKASAKRFRVTGSGKLVRRRSGKQHLLAKKNTKRKLRLSKMHHKVNRRDYDNVIGALPYLKVNRKAT